jgi:hypothetical protein
MLSPLFGSENCERVLIFLLSRDEGYASEIAKFFGTDLSQIQNQLKKLETARVLVSFSVGRTRLYRYNPSYPFLQELKCLLEKALSFYPPQVRECLFLNRRRPRRSGKPL